jgi:two-component system, NtrC family, sensor kinase
LKTNRRAGNVENERMTEKRPGLKLSFSTKVLVPFIITIVLLVSFAIWILNNQITRQFKSVATENLLTARKIFDNLEVMRSRHLLLRSSTTPNDPRFRAIAQLGEPNTLRFLLKELTEELRCDYISFRDRNGKVVTSVTRDPLIDIEQWPDFGSLAADRAMNGDPVPDMDYIENDIYRLAAIPVAIGSDVIGTLTIAEKFSEASAKEFFNLTGCRVVLFINQLPVMSTVPAGDLSQLSVNPAASNGNTLLEKESIQTITLENDHVLALGRQFRKLGIEQQMQYALVLSYEQTLQALRHVQLLLLGAGLLSILISSVVIGLVIGRITNPLRVLRKSAEAVARRDFSQKITTVSSDELGDLAAAFNQMIDSLRQSTEELQATINTLQSTRAQLIQSEKLSALGEFIAGITHELNNPLCTIVGFSELLKEQNSDAAFSKDLDLIAEAGNRCHKIVQNLLSFARQRPAERKASKLNEILDATLNFMSYDLRTSNVSIVREYDPSLPVIIADTHQLQQVFLNLINNARQAIVSSRDRGNIIIRTMQRGKNAVIQIADDGPGIPPENLGRIFDPFFTTKEVGKGTGLGLSVSYGIIREHNGDISVQSKVGKGTTFEIQLPIADAVNGNGSDHTSRHHIKSDPLPGEGRKVLVIDDERDVLTLIKEILVSDHFVVETVTDADDALQMCKYGWFDIILCDWRMPGMTGRIFYENLRSLKPAAATRLIFMTGDVMNDQTMAYLKGSGKVCINKPFSLEDFRQIIRQLIT